jgi:hypothetical protein
MHADSTMTESEMKIEAITGTSVSNSSQSLSTTYNTTNIMTIFSK